MLDLGSVVNGVTTLWNALSKDEPAAGSTVLSVRLLLRSDKPYVGLELSTSELPPDVLSVSPADEPGKPVTWEVPLEAFGAVEGSGFGAPAPLEVPAMLVSDLRYCLERLEGASRRPLWLRLIRPYGLLGSAAWERTLCGELQRPTLRLPDFPERPAERTDALENAVVVDPPPDTDESVLKTRVRTLIESVLEASSRSRTRVHVFTRRRWYPSLSLFDADSRVTVYDPDQRPEREWAPADADADAPPNVLRAARSDRATQLRSAAWATWIAGALDGRGLDALHLVCRSKWTDSGACLVLSNSPAMEEDEITLREIGYEELELLAIRSGAWSVTFVPATVAQSHPMACVADGFAQRRAGAVLFHSLCEAQEDASFGAACRLLFGGTSRAPRLTQGFLYCHPDFIYQRAPASSGIPGDTAGLFRFLAENAKLVAARAPLKERLLSTATRFVPLVKTREVTAPPGWLGAAQRFLEAAAFDEVRRSASDLLLSRPTSKTGQTDKTNRQDEKTKAAIDILTEIQGVLKNHAKTNKEES
ncbi:hypothetical protein ACFSHT_05610 [Paraburkholderia silviterrae]|uniref:Uncharacterized protein n=1 Tax=Paraburkholderia silviterrae TaxID=2528715 RepID=A0A4R5M4C0_9BURK|nr:hypothetical protein [Paraburkholderia silviterrae]TDG20627.1 hypothetical protein EYW47_26025 [Paraburkholderia silviterrae]